MFVKNEVAFMRVPTEPMTSRDADHIARPMGYRKRRCGVMHPLA
jgi:hypothetical protein